MQLCGFHCINGYSICILVIFPCIFISYCNYRVNHREFLWLVVASRCQMSSDINILHHSYQEWLKYQAFTAFQVKFHVSGSICNFPLTGNDLCHSQPNGIFYHFLMPVIQCIVAQWRNISSESAVNIWQQNVSKLTYVFNFHQIWCQIIGMGHFTCINICGRKSVQ